MLDLSHLKPEDYSHVPPELLDFRNVLYLVWHFLGLPDPTPIQYDIAYHLQHGPRRQVNEAFRGVGKSWITSAFACWLLKIAPQLKILVVSASKERSDNFTTFTRRLIDEMPLLQDLRPGLNQRDSKIAFDVAPARPDHAPSVKSVGIFGQMAGSRADVIIADDVEVPNNALTQQMRERLSEAVKEFDAILKPDGRVVFLGTPQTEESLYNRLPDRGYTIRIWPARIPAHKKLENYRGRLAPFIVNLMNEGAPEGAPTDPVRFNEFDLQEREASYGRSGFALQFMLDTTLSDAERYPLKLRDLIVMGLSPDVAPTQVVWGSSPDQQLGLPNVGFTGDRLYRPMYISQEWIPYTGSVLTIDPAGRGADEVGYAVTKMLHGRVFLRRAGGLSGGYDEANLRTLANIAKEEKVNLIKIEDNFGDGMFSKLFAAVLKNIYPCTIEDIHSTGQKERRIIDTLEPVMNQHRLIVDQSVIEEDAKKVDSAKGGAYQLFYQMTHITKDRGALKHDDRLEAVAMGVAHWIEALGIDTDDAEKARKEDALLRELEEFVEEVLGHGTIHPHRYFDIENP